MSISRPETQRSQRLKQVIAKKSAQVIGAENLLKPMVKKYIAERMEKIASNRVMGYTEAVELLTSIARGELMEKLMLTWRKLRLS